MRRGRCWVRVFTPRRYRSIRDGRPFSRSRIWCRVKGWISIGRHWPTSCVPRVCARTLSRGRVRPTVLPTSPMDELGATAGEVPTIDPEALVATLHEVARALPERINADPERVEQGLARLVLTLIEVVRKVLEHQAVRRMD